MLQQRVETLLAADARLELGATIKDLAGLAARRASRGASSRESSTRHGNSAMERTMDCLRISGGVPLHGSVTASGSKNAALPIMAASILADGPVMLERVPDLVDVNTLALLLGHLGRRGQARPPTATLRIDTVDPAPTRADYDLVRRMRASFCVLGPLVAQAGQGRRLAARRLQHRHPAGRSAPGRLWRRWGPTIRIEARLRHRRGPPAARRRRSTCADRTAPPSPARPT